MKSGPEPCKGQFAHPGHHGSWGFGRQWLRAFGRYALAKRKALPSSTWPLAPLIVNELQTSFPQGEDQQTKLTKPLTSMRKTACTAEK
jgi:hypothetical protein